MSHIHKSPIGCHIHFFFHFEQAITLCEIIWSVSFHHWPMFVPKLFSFFLFVPGVVHYVHRNLKYDQHDKIVRYKIIYKSHDSGDLLFKTVRCTTCFLGIFTCLNRPPAIYDPVVSCFKSGTILQDPLVL